MSSTLAGAVRKAAESAASAVLAEHLPGKHSQKDHAGEGGAPDAAGHADREGGEAQGGAARGASGLAMYGDRAAEIAAAPKFKDGMKSREAFAAAYVGTFAGLRTTIGELEVTDYGVKVEGSIYDGSGKKAGYFMRTYHPESSSMTHSALVLRKNVQGSGFAREFNHNAENVYIANGVRYIDLHANFDVGGYAWARQGYDFRGGDDVVIVRNRVIYRIESARRSGAVGAGDASAATRAVEKMSKPWELAAVRVPKKDGSGYVDAGKMGMLGSSWYGRKKLGPSDATYIVGEASYKEKAKK